MLEGRKEREGKKRGRETEENKKTEWRKDAKELGSLGQDDSSKERRRSSSRSVGACLINYKGFGRLIHEMFKCFKSESVSHSVMSDSFRPHRLGPKSTIKSQQAIIAKLINIESFTQDQR